MPKVLYNKYRSADFDRLIGQEHITKILKNAVLTGRISHAYLFVGSRGTGKTSTARILSKALNCTNIRGDGNPCSECKSCLDISNGKFLDLIEIDAASNRGIDQIRELKEKIEFSPVEGKYKIYIIDEVHMLTKEAFNALLKTLEEPPNHVIFMLATTDVHKLPPTILSRCQRYDFRLGTNENIAQTLSGVVDSEGVKLEDGALRLLVESAKGSYRDSLSLLDAVISGQNNSDDPKIITEAEVRLILGIPDSSMVSHFLASLIEGDQAGALKFINEIESRGININQFIKYCLNALQSILISKLSNSEIESEYSFANSLDINKVTNIINQFLVADRNLRQSDMPILILNLLIVQVGLVVGSVKPEVSSSKVSYIKGVNETINNTVKVEIKEKVAPVVNQIEKEINSDVAPVVSAPVGNAGIEAKEDVEEEEDSVSDASPIDLTFENISLEWKSVVNSLRAVNGHLFAFLGGAKLVSFENSTLLLEVPFEFHKDRIESVSSRDAITASLSKIYGKAFKVECCVNSNPNKKRQVSADIILQNVPTQQSAPKATTDNKEKPARKISQKVEAVFAGM